MLCTPIARFQLVSKNLSRSIGWIIREHGVGLPELVWRRGFVTELIIRFDDDERRAGDQVVRLEEPVN